MTGSNTQVCGRGRRKVSRVKIRGKDNIGNWVKGNCELEFFGNTLGRILKRLEIE